MSDEQPDADDVVVWVAFGPVAGPCGHRHLTPRAAARCTSQHRPKVGRLPSPRKSAEWAAPARGEYAAPRSRAWDALTLVVLGLVALAAWQVFN